jgi:hypothetical protein
MPVDGSPCTHDGLVCNYGCDNGGPGDASCESALWSVARTKQACFDAGGPLACGSITCGAKQYCVQPCCGGAPAVCLPMPDSGVCPTGTSPGVCAGTGEKGCVGEPCTPPPPYCVDDPNQANGCSSLDGSRYLTCLCA